MKPARSHWKHFLALAAFCLVVTPSALAAAGEPPEGLSAGAWQAISGAIERDRYGARPAADFGAVEAANPAQGYDARFTADGVTVSLGGAAELSLTLVGAGFGEALEPVAAAVPRVDDERGQRVEYVRGAITEWYVNRPSGLEQGWTLAAPPGENPGGEPLRLALAVGGGLEPVLATDGSAVELRDAGGASRLRYAGLAAWDANGRELPARLEAVGGRIAIAVEAAGAAYPVTVDPTILNESAKLLASDAAQYDRFGTSIAVSGSTVVVGAIGSSVSVGSVYVFEEPAGGWSGTLNESAKLLPSDGGTQFGFGSSVAVSGSTVVVGHAGNDDNGSRAGAAYVFTKPAGGWSGTLNESAKLLAGDGLSSDSLGDSVAISGSTVVAGAPLEFTRTFRHGAAYVFEEPAGGWTGTLNHTAKLLASDRAEGDELGVSIAVSGSTVVVAAVFDDDNGDRSGSAYVFEEPAGGWAGTLNENAKLLASDGAADDQFGFSVAMSGSTVVVGAVFDDDNVSNSGSAYVFTEPAGGWAGTLNENAKLLSSDSEADDRFGYSVAVSGSTVVVGAPLEDSNLLQSGAAYVFEEPAGGWAGTLNETTKLRTSDGEAGQRQVGRSVAVSDSAIWAGAPFSSDDGIWSGAAYVFGSATCTDGDGDGYGSPGDASCPNGAAEDCDDADSDVNPGATETTCDMKDNDCSAATLDDPNADGDPVSLCSGDCDDGDADVYPGNSETTCDTKDNDCSAATPDDPNADGDPVSLCSGDCDDGDADVYPGNSETTCDTKDNDCSAATLDDPNADGDPVSLCSGDCDDGDADVYPGNAETTCDTKDNDCSAATLDDPNADGDPVSLCSGDCDDGDADVYPGNTETTCDTKDNDCSAATLDDPNADGDPVSLCSGDCADDDSDVYPGNSETTCDTKDNDCSAATLDDPNADGDPVSLCSGDCDDGDPDVYPGNSETTCDTKDNDCSAATLDDPNADGDPVSLCSGDCDDGDPDVYPGNSETTCDTKDNDCSAATLDDPNTDGDPVSLCSGDCDDGDADVYPGNSETTCDTKDNDCSAATLDDPNADGDPVSLCSGDCDDGDADVYPGNSETICDTKDNDCSAATADVVPPGFAESFDPDTILGTGQSTLSFTIDNSVCGLPAMGLAFSNLLPYDLLVADTPAVVNTCGGTVTAPGGSAGVDLFGGTVGGGESCGLSVAIAAPSIGSFVSATGDLTSSTGNSGTASATLTVLDCPAANGSHMTLSSGVVLMPETYEVCNTIEVPEHFLVLGPSGVLALRAGVAVVLNNGVEIGSDGVLEVTIDPSLFVP